MDACRTERSGGHGGHWPDLPRRNIRYRQRRHNIVIINKPRGQSSTRSLPPADTDIKGQMKSTDELLQVSGYAQRPQDFDDLIRVLDRELHLITPTDSSGDGHDAPAGKTGNSRKYYQLTHDYLVHSFATG